MSSTVPSPPLPASATRRGTMSAEHFSKLDALMSAAAQEARFGAIESNVASNGAAITTLQGSSHVAVTLDGASSTWLTLVGQALKLTLVAAGAAADGIVTQLAQTFAGVKTFTSAIVAAAGITLQGNLVGDVQWRSSAGSNVQQMNDSYWKVQRGVAAAVSINEAGGGSAQLYNVAAGVEVAANETRIWGRGTQSTDIAVKLGPSTADGSVHSSASVVEMGTGVGGTFVRKVWVAKDGTIKSANGRFVGSSANNGYLACDDVVGAVAAFQNNFMAVSSASMRFVNIAVGGTILALFSSGEVGWRGVDASGTIGADTKNWPSGINTIASGATSVTITNSLVPNPATTKVRISVNWRADPGARHWVTQNNGSFTVNLAAAPGSNVSFDWEVNSLL